MKPVLVIMAAGIGSRYGGLKQCDPIGPSGELIIDYSVYDAIKAGFETVIFVINRQIEQDFKSIIGDKLKDYITVEYVYQERTDLPAEIEIPRDRKKPWGTAHALYTCRDKIKGPFVAINADDFYGCEAFDKIYDYLIQNQELDKLAMVGYKLENTITENGYVSRGVCEIQNGRLVGVTERLRIEKREQAIAYYEQEEWVELEPDSIVSMNMWGFTELVMTQIKRDIKPFLNRQLQTNPLKCEYFIPYVVDQLIQQEKATVAVLTTDAKWYGVTYQQDKQRVVKAVRQMVEQGLYPAQLWK